MKTIDSPTSFLSRPDDEWSSLRLKRSIAGLASVIGADRDERGRFVGRSQSAVRERQPSIPLRAEWWMAI